MKRHKVKAYPETHQRGHLMMEMQLSAGITMGLKECDFGIQIADDGRVWICIDGKAAIRFKPLWKEEER